MVGENTVIVLIVEYMVSSLLNLIMTKSIYRPYISTMRFWEQLIEICVHQWKHCWQNPPRDLKKIQIILRCFLIGLCELGIILKNYNHLLNWALIVYFHGYVKKIFTCYTIYALVVGGGGCFIYFSSGFILKYATYFFMIIFDMYSVKAAVWFVMIIYLDFSWQVI